MSKSLFLCLAICKTIFGLAGNDLGSDDVKLGTWNSLRLGYATVA